MVYHHLLALILLCNSLSFWKDGWTDACNFACLSRIPLVKVAEKEREPTSWLMHDPS